ncbi:RHS repeat-associated core domain-containing protein [Cohnella thailandensis]|uniref:RHS repeat-associated core domain-containing protein n=1 Tax=Cohnella thailandensis TaxID=557557 RepID=UPI00315AEF2D
MLVVEQYSSSIRYSGEFFDAEVGLYYLRARYYDPYVGRFISRDSYEGQADDPMSLNRYTYTHNNPLIFWDPTGHWVASDNNLNVEDQAKIVALTSAYYKATSAAERTAISQQANDIRNAAKDSRKLNMYPEDVITPLVFQADTISSVVSTAVSHRGYMTEKEWTQVTSSVGISITSQQSVNVSKGDTMTKTTTTIGRTNITVTSQNVVTAVTAMELKSKASSSISFSYNLSANEAKFVSSVADPSISLEQTLVVLDTLQRNNGNITKKQLEDINVKVYSGLKLFGFDLGGGTIDGLEMAYDFSTKGYTVAEAAIEYQLQYGPNIGEVFGVAAMGIGGGGLRVYSGKPAIKSSTLVSKNFKSGTVNKDSNPGSAGENGNLEGSTYAGAAASRNAASKGTGKSLVKDTGSISENTANLRAWAEQNGWVRQDTAGGVEQWGVRDANGKFSWRLKLKPEVSTREGLGTGSNQPRFDVRLDDKGTSTSYINPFTGERGGKSVGTHIPLGK